MTDKTLEIVGPSHVAAIARRLGLYMQQRGTDATGIARLSPIGRLTVTKDPVPAHQFFKAHDQIGWGSRAFIVHTRQKTTGTEKNPLNNHPISYEHIVGIHNGWIINDDTLYKEHGWPRYGEVDSSVIFAAIAKLGWKQALESIDGPAAVAWFDLEAQTLNLARATSSPLCVGFSSLGDMVFASTEEAVESALDMLPVDPVAGIATKPDFLKEGSIVIHDLVTGDLSTDSFEPIEYCGAWTKPTWHGSGYGHGWTSWGDREGTETWQKMTHAPDAVANSGAISVPDGVVEGALAWFEPEDEDNYPILIGVVEKLYWRRADLEVAIDHDINIVICVPIDRLSAYEESEREWKPPKSDERSTAWDEEEAEQRARDRAILDDFLDRDEISPRLAQALEVFAKAPLELNPGGTADA